MTFVIKKYCLGSEVNNGIVSTIFWNVKYFKRTVLAVITFLSENHQNKK